MATTLDFTQQVIVTAQALDVNGVQVNFTAPPTFAVGNPALSNLVALASTDPQPVAGQFAMWLVPIAGQTGTDTVTVTEDAVLGDATTQIQGTLAYTVTTPGVITTPDLATSIAVTAGTPSAQATGTIAANLKRK
jgi:hypothetical protein